MSDGVVILEAAKAREELWHVSEIRAKDATLAKEIQTLMKPPIWPGQVFVPVSEEAA